MKRNKSALQPEVKCIVALVVFPCSFPLLIFQEGVIRRFLFKTFNFLRYSNLAKLFQGILKCDP